VVGGLLVEWEEMEVCGGGDGVGFIGGREEGRGVAFDDLRVPGTDVVVLVLGDVLQGGIAGLLYRVVRNERSWLVSVCRPGLGFELELRAHGREVETYISDDLAKFRGGNGLKVEVY
jgi:hypothetical protein